MRKDECSADALIDIPTKTLQAILPTSFKLSQSDSETHLLTQTKNRSVLCDIIFLR